MHVLSQEDPDLQLAHVADESAQRPPREPALEQHASQRVCRKLYVRLHEGRAASRFGTLDAQAWANASSSIQGTIYTCGSRPCWKIQRAQPHEFITCMEEGSQSNFKRGCMVGLGLCEHLVAAVSSTSLLNVGVANVLTSRCTWSTSNPHDMCQWPPAGSAYTACVLMQHSAWQH